MEFTAVGKLKISEIFNITNRGIALLSEITMGEVTEGNYFKIDFEGRELVYKINSVESIRAKAANKIGLLIKPENNPPLSYIERIIG